MEQWKTSIKFKVKGQAHVNVKIKYSIPFLNIMHFSLEKRVPNILSSPFFIHSGISGGFSEHCSQYVLFATISDSINLFQFSERRLGSSKSRFPNHSFGNSNCNLEILLKVNFKNSDRIQHNVQVVNFYWMMWLCICSMKWLDCVTHAVLTLADKSTLIV
jgi:hypothetical protein